MEFQNDYMNNKITTEIMAVKTKKYVKITKVLRTVSENAHMYFLKLLLRKV